MKSGSSLLLKLHSYFIPFLKPITLLYYFIRLKGLQPVLCVICTPKMTSSFRLFTLFLFTYPPSSPVDLLIFPLSAPAFLPLPLLCSCPSVSLHIKVICHGPVERHRFCKASPDLCIWKCIFLSLSFYGSYQSGSNQNSIPCHLFYQREFNLELNRYIRAKGEGNLEVIWRL